MLEKIEIVDCIEVLGNGSVQVRTNTAIMEDGKHISGKFHRHIISPGDDYSKEDNRVKSICAAIHTDDVIAAYKSAQGV